MALNRLITDLSRLITALSRLIIGLGQAHNTCDRLIMALARRIMVQSRHIADLAG